MVHADPTTVEWIGPVLLMAAGGLLIAGLVTPLASVLAAVTMATAGDLQDVSWTVPVMAILVCLILQGPGAYSIDARLFGRREIIIPPAPRREYHD